jgi:hypothetical protein
MGHRLQWNSFSTARRRACPEQGSSGYCRPLSARLHEKEQSQEGNDDAAFDGKESGNAFLFSAAE